MLQAWYERLLAQIAIDIKEWRGTQAWKDQEHVGHVILHHSTTFNPFQLTPVNTDVCVGQAQEKESIEEEEEAAHKVDHLHCFLQLLDILVF